MNDVVIVRRGRDGRDYPVPMPPPEEERSLARVLAHLLICGQGMSYRTAQRSMREEHGLRRSLGQLYYVIHHFECGPGCLSVQGGDDDR